MRITYFAFILFLLSSANSFAQRMTAEGNQWGVYEPPTFSPNSSTRLFRIEGDTLMGDFLYKTIYTTRDTSGSNWNRSNNFIREDSTGKVFLKVGGDDEFLLYDFSLEVNDTIPFNLGFNDVCELVVYSIDTILLSNGEERRKLNLGNQFFGENSGDFWIEGIGSSRGPLFNMYCYTDQNFILLCYQENDEILYSSKFGECFITQTSNLLPSDIKIFPNPFNETLNINHGVTKLESFKIIDLMSRVVFESAFESQSYQLNSLAEGTYIILLKDTSGNVYSDKLIKMKS